MITLNENYIKEHNLKEQKTFKGAVGFTGLTKAADLFIKSQENLSYTRFIQDTATNWVPKAIFSRSKADFAEMSFLEFLESAIFYFASPILGEKIFRNTIFKNLQPKEYKNIINTEIPKRVKEITNNEILSEEIKKRAISTKAGIVLACTIIPVAEYTLSFAKNLFTLKAFKKSNFENIANLNKNNYNKENKEQQNIVENNAKKQLKKAAVISSIGIISGILLSLTGHKSETLQNISKTILEPGQTLSKLSNKTDKTKSILNKFSLDFSNDKGKLALSKGQLALTAILGLFGYSKAAEDRGKLDVAEVWTRVPLVVFYTIFGSELFEKGFTSLLYKNNKFPELIKKSTDGKIIIPTREQLPEIAEKLALKNNLSIEKELSKLTKEKAIISAIPYAFSLIFMGFTLSGITRLWTQYRYNKQQKEGVAKNLNFIELAKINTPNIFQEIENNS